uniref:Lipocalin/cytosolic fatty-acid binding domain-containing protein n=2 Tax=Helicotheca tamesis TaxID=374047 RepID=A0A7S2N008_9STRA|mmetsp:Transcript_6726/g.9080  ORF Transcript_6726/g.9080 Transcript_6726/m.9080 type:complete len:211 (+) Transcript_6726:184-816(+)
MDNFDLEKYQGKWYEQKFHDWTQFKEVYDTTLDIKLTTDGKGWIDDFGVKGPAPASAKLSWDKSPVANGGHYFLFGRLDEKDPPGVLRESGFGVEFPNYIVDVQKDPETGEYTEAIQFQCLERGGVRVFEGINFMSRKPEMTAEELKAMHTRAEKAGMYQYGASEEQMHTVARRPVDAPAIDNSWQAMWRALGVDRLLELLTESIEDGGR